MFAPVDIREITAYNRAVLARYERALRRLTWKESGKDRGTGHLSLRDTYVHIVQVHDGWLNFVVPARFGDMEGRPDPFEFHSWKEIGAWADSVFREIQARTAALTARELRRVVRAPWMPGRYTVSDAYLQVTMEQAHHLGEIIAAFWQMDRAPPDMTWIDTRRNLTRRRPR
ncbi:MAG: DinB family protein [Thermoplasmata archaeon]|nr:DinB family protein [Thermoplasmata archaeon]MCI4356259.1 DinB family protein [Thermoplasmata archaeon]